MDAIREFFAFSKYSATTNGVYLREPSGAYSWQHLTFVTSLVVIMTLLAIFFGLRYRRKGHDHVLIVSAIVIDSLEILKIVLSCIRSHDISSCLNNLPLFLCSIQLITIPMAAFCKGIVREASLDFVAIFGLLGALAGTYGAAQNYSAYPVLGFDNVVSGLTHCISGFCALYILIGGLASLKYKNMWITFAIMLFFCLAAWIVDITIEKNYMFLMSDDGTPYTIVKAIVGGNAALYSIAVVVLFMIYIAAFYFFANLFRNKDRKAA